MSAAIALPTIAELDASKYSLDEVDSQLRFLSSMLKYSSNKASKRNCLKKLDYFLDIRLELTK